MTRILFALCLAASVAACEDDDDFGGTTDGGLPPPTPRIDAATPQPGTVHEIGMQNDRFMPANMTIRAGDTVRWTNGEDELHTVTSGPGSNDPNAGALFDEQLPDQGSSFAFRFQTAGTYPYFCRVHELMGMTGTITVQN
jgi:plastocyanin